MIIKKDSLVTGKDGIWFDADQFGEIKNFRLSYEDIALLYNNIILIE
jgi:hypothetical protein